MRKRSVFHYMSVCVWARDFACVQQYCRVGPCDHVQTAICRSPSADLVVHEMAEFVCCVGRLLVSPSYGRLLPDLH